MIGLCEGVSSSPFFKNPLRKALCLSSNINVYVEGMFAYHIDLELLTPHRFVHAYSPFTGLVKVGAQGQEITLALEGRSR